MPGESVKVGASFASKRPLSLGGQFQSPTEQTKQLFLKETLAWILTLMSPRLMC